MNGGTKTISYEDLTYSFVVNYDRCNTANYGGFARLEGIDDKITCDQNGEAKGILCAAIIASRHHSIRAFWIDSIADETFYAAQGAREGNG